MGDKELRLFGIFTKVNDEERTVEGVITSEAEDVQEDVVDYEATKVAVEDWRKWGNIREMHQPKAAGVAEAITLNDDAKNVVVKSKIVDDDAWTKVKAGVYKGYSIGGRVLAAVMQKSGDHSVRRITKYQLNEVSLVDRPANPEAVFSVVKRADDEPESGEQSTEGDEEEQQEKQPDETPEQDADKETPAADTTEKAAMPDPVAELAKALDLVTDLAKAGRQLSSSNVEKIHGAINSLAALCAGAGCQKCATALKAYQPEEEGTEKKAAAGAEQAPVLDTAVLNKAVQDQLTTALAGMGFAKAADIAAAVEGLAKAEQVTALEGRVKTLEDAPAPGGPMLRAGAPVEKVLGGSAAPAVTDEIGLLSKMIGEVNDPTARDVLGRELAYRQALAQRQR